VALGFALKDLAASILAGLIIIIDRPFQVGDRVNFNGTYGTSYPSACDR
jgi:small-conductance mechanosensitive channel